MSASGSVGDYMVRVPVTAALWQALSFIRQMILSKSFSFLPVKTEASDSPGWSLVSDVALARLVRRNGDAERKRLLSMPLSDAIRDEKFELTEPLIRGPDASLD